jgi:hypothetical protein
MAEEITLPPQTFDKLKEANKNIKMMKSFMTKAKLAGSDITQHEKVVRDNETRIRKLRDAFFTGQNLG